MEWFSQRNVDLKIESDQRIFPETNSSQTIIDTFINETTQKKVNIITRCVVKEIIPEDDAYIVKTSQGDFTAQYIVYATGSAPKSLRLIEELGHKIVPPVPSLFTFNIKDPLLQDLPGTSFTYAEIDLPELKLSESGPLLITHWGLSGPAILKLSAWGARKLAEIGYKFRIIVNFTGLSTSVAEEAFLAYREAHPKKSIGQSKMFDITNRFWNTVLQCAKINPEKQIAQISKKEISALLDTLCNYSMQVNGKSTFKDEFVTAGGVDLKEVDFKTMKSKRLSNIYLAGEVLNIDAITGGFNFQACWSEAWLIAQDLNAK